MKYFLCFFLIPSYLFAQKSPSSSLVLSGKIEGLDKGMIYFVKYDTNDTRKLDSVLIKNGRFSYRTNLHGYLDRFFIKLNPTNSFNNDSLNNVRVPVENGRLNIELKMGHFSEYVLEGCGSCDIIKVFDSINRMRYDVNTAFEAIYEDSSLSQNAKEILESTELAEREKSLRIWLSYFKSEKSINTKTYLLFRLANHLELQQIKTLAGTLDKNIRNSFYGASLLRLIKNQELEKVRDSLDLDAILNKPVYLFSANTYDNTKISLQDVYKSGVTVLDFWASWCKPCRNTHPKMISLFEKYSKEHFNVISISVDESRSDWINAIQKDSLFKWTNILSYENNQLVNLDDKYKVSSYPTKFLINKDGIVIGVFVGDDFKAFEDKLEEIFHY